MRQAHRLKIRLFAGLSGLMASNPVIAQVPAPAAPPQAQKIDPASKSLLPEPPPNTILKPDETPMDLGTALKMAGVENPELLLARARVAEAVAQRQLAVAQLLPDLNIGSNFDSHNGVLQQSNGTILGVNRNSTYFGLGAGAVGAGTVNVPGLFYNGNVGEAWYGILITRQRVRTREFTDEATRNDVLLRTCLGYLDLLGADGRRSIAKRNREQAAEVARLTAEYANAKQGRKADADRAAVELGRRDIEMTQSEGDTLAASARLCQILSLDPSTRLKPIDGWVVPAPIVPDPIPLTELIAIAMLERPELAARRSEVKTALYELSLAKVLPFSPNVILGYSAGGFGGGSNITQTSDYGGRSDFDAAIFLTFKNMGVGNLATVRIADSRMKQSQYREIETLNQIRAEVAEAHARVTSRYLQIELAEKAVRAGTNAFAEDMTRIKGGDGIPLELLDSLRILCNARYKYLETIIGYNRAQFQLWVALGRPPANALARPVPADLVPPPILPAVQGDPRVVPMSGILPKPQPREASNTVNAKVPEPSPVKQP